MNNKHKTWLKQRLFSDAVDLIRMTGVVSDVHSVLPHLSKQVMGLDDANKISRLAIDCARRYQKFADPAIPLPVWIQNLLVTKP